MKLGNKDERNERNESLYSIEIFIKNECSDNIVIKMISREMNYSDVIGFVSGAWRVGSPCSLWGEQEWEKVLELSEDGQETAS